MNSILFEREWLVEPFIVEDFAPHNEHYGLVLAPYQFRFTIPIRNHNDQLLVRRAYKLMDSYVRQVNKDGAELHYYLEKCRPSCICFSSVHYDAAIGQTFMIDVDIRDLGHFIMEFESFICSTLSDRWPINTILGINPNTNNDLLALLTGGVAEC